MTLPNRILLVDDDRALRETLSDILSEEGYQVDCACNGREALDRLSRDSLPNLILLDLVMPVMDGWAFRDAQRNLPELAGIPMVVLSASFPPDSPRIRAMGVQAVLPKPVGLERLLCALERILPAQKLAAAL